MAFDFSKFNFEVIDLNINVSPDIFINSSHIAFSRRVLENLGYPPFVQYCVDPAQKAFAIRACKGSESHAVPFSKPKSEQKGSCISHNRNLREAVAALIPHYKSKQRYRVTGQYDQQEKTLVFMMEEAEPYSFHREEKEGESE